MKKLLISPLLVLMLFFVSCGGNSNPSSEDAAQKISVENPTQFAKLIESVVDSVYFGFNVIEDLDANDVPKKEFLAGTSKLSTEISKAKATLKSIESIGERSEPLMEAAKKCLVASKKLLSFLEKNSTLLSKPDETWTDSEFTQFDKRHTKFNEGLEGAMDDLYDASNAYLSNQPDRTKN